MITWQRREITCSHVAQIVSLSIFAQDSFNFFNFSTFECDTAQAFLSKMDHIPITSLFFIQIQSFFGLCIAWIVNSFSSVQKIVNCPCNIETYFAELMFPLHSTRSEWPSLQIAPLTITRNPHASSLVAVFLSQTLTEGAFIPTPFHCQEIMQIMTHQRK